MNLERGLLASDDDYTLNKHLRFSNKSQQKIDIALLACVVIGLAIRLVAASGGPWLDEIWSWEIAREGEVLVAHDNNHLLNTLWLWLMKDSSQTLAWRLPSVICGGISIWITGIILRRLGREHAITGALLIAICHPLVVYQSEARGYASMLMCMLICIDLQLRWLEYPERRRQIRLGLITAAMFGVLSHLSFGLFYVLLVICGYVISRFDRRMLVDHAIGFGFIGFWWLVFGRRMSIGGGNELQALDVFSATISDIIGYTLSAHIGWIVAAVLMLIGCAFSIRNKSSRLAIILATITIGYPILILLMKDKLIYVRYFLPAILCATMLIASLLGQLFVDRRWSVIGVILLMLIAKGHGTQDASLLMDGRDHHSQAIARMMSKRGREVSVGSPANFQLRTILNYYAMKQQTPIAELIDEGPEWLVIMHSPSPDTIIRGNHIYDLDSSYPAHSLSGIPWEIYRRREMQVEASVE